MGKRRVTLDTNILISALGWKGNPHRIIDKVVNGELDLFMSYSQFDEFMRVLDYPRFGFSEEQKRRFKELIVEISTFVKTSGKLALIKEDPSDNIILECALVANVDYVVSGDKKHVLPIKRLGRTKVVTAREMLKLIG